MIIYANHEAHNALGNALVQLDKLDAAITSYEQALALRPDSIEVYCCGYFQN